MIFIPEIFGLGYWCDCCNDYIPNLTFSSILDLLTSSLVSAIWSGEIWYSESFSKNFWTSYSNAIYSRGLFYCKFMLMLILSVMVLVGALLIVFARLKLIPNLLILFTELRKLVLNKRFSSVPSRSLILKLSSPSKFFYA